MRKAARHVRSHLARLFWAGAVGVSALLLMSRAWDLGDARGLLGAVILLTGAAISASVCRSIEKANDGSIELLLDALRDDMPTQEPDARPLHAAG